MIYERIVTFSELNARAGTQLPEQLIGVIRSRNGTVAVGEAVARLPLDAISIGRSFSEVRLSAPFYDPPKIWGIGLNYRNHAADLGAQVPSEPASFMKPRTTIIGPGDPIALPPESKRVTAEAELGVVIGKHCKNVSEERADSQIFGYVPVLDITAEDILQRNPRFLTRAKSFDTFLSIGPFVLTPDEIDDLANLTVGTVHNGRIVRSNKVHNMTFSPQYLLSFHSHVMTFEPGDILLTGTPGAVVIEDGDLVECMIDGFPVLSNPARKAV